MQKKKLRFISSGDFTVVKCCVKQILFIFSVFVFFSAAAFAQTKAAAESSLLPTLSADFESDGCSKFPDYDYRDCCVEHDKAYFAGGSWTLRWRADKRLYKCVAAKKGFEHKFIAPVMWAGVRVFGVPFLPTSFRWGFGKNKIKVKNIQPGGNKKEQKILKDSKREKQ